jgi:hypothetical protein
VREVIQND